MSTLNVGTIKSLGSSAPVFQNSSGVEKGQLARAWINFDGTGTVAIKDSFNVSSITDNGSGDYSINFSTAMSNSNYSAVVSHNHGFPSNGGSNTRQIGLMDTPYGTGGFRISIELPNSGPGDSRSDSNRVTAAVFGDQ